MILRRGEKDEKRRRNRDRYKERVVRRRKKSIFSSCSKNISFI